MVYLNCFKDWETSQSAKISFIFMNPSTGKEVYVDRTRSTTKVTAYNWIELISENMKKGYEIVLDLMLQIDEPYTDDSDVDIADEEDNWSQLPGPDQDSEVNLLLKLQAQKDSSKQSNHFDNRAICKPHLYQPLKSYKKMDLQKAAIANLAVHLESPTSASLRAVSSIQETEATRSHLRKQSYSSASYTATSTKLRYTNHGTSRIRDSINKSSNSRHDSSTVKDDSLSQWSGDNGSESGSITIPNDSERLEKLLARVLELAETRRNEDKKNAAEASYLDTEVPEYGEAYAWKSPAFGRIHYPRPNAPDPIPTLSKWHNESERPEDPHWLHGSESTPAESSEPRSNPSKLSRRSIIEELPIGFAEIHRQMKAHKLKDRIISNVLSSDLDLGDLTEPREMVNGPYLPYQTHHSTCTCFTCFTDDIDMRMALTMDPSLAILFKISTKAQPHTNLLQQMVAEKDYISLDSDNFQAQEAFTKLRVVRSTKSESSKYRIRGYINALSKFYADSDDDPADSLHSLDYNFDKSMDSSDPNEQRRYTFMKSTSFLFRCFFKLRLRHICPTTLVYWTSVKRILDATTIEVRSSFLVLQLRFLDSFPILNKGFCLSFYLHF